MLALTNFGDTAVLLPLSALFLLWLAITRSSGAALWWFAILAVCGVLLVLLKVYCYDCPPLASLRSPSGHSGFSVLAYGGLTLAVAAEQRSVGTRFALFLACAALVLGIAVSRVILRFHSVPEISVGLGVGLLGFSAFAWVYSREHRRGRAGGLMPLLVGSAMVVVAFHGGKLDVEDLLHLFGRRLHVREVCTGSGDHLRSALNMSAP